MTPTVWADSLGRQSGPTVWAVVVSETARKDIRKIRRWSVQCFGTTRADSHVQALAAVMRKLNVGPTLPGVRQRFDLPAGMLILRAPSARDRGQHVLLLRCREDAEQSRSDVLRVLQLRMDLPRHLAKPKLAKPAPPR